MSAQDFKSQDTRGRFFNYANNPITIAGAVLAALSAVILVTVVAINAMGGHLGPYSGIMAFMILPGVFVFGLLVIPAGIWLRRRKLLAAHVSEEEMSRYPRLDFNDEHLRKGVLIFLALTMGNAIIFATVTYLGVEFMESPRFCGTVCHTVMSPEYAAYQNSPHSRVMCVQCHIGPGASWFVKAKVDGLRQVVATTLNTFSRPIHSPIAHLRPARETCEQCHWPSKHIGDKLRAFVRYADDEANTPSYNAMLIKTGGGDLDTGKHGGIHWWHIYSDNKIRYIQGDERRMSISWVELTDSKGEVRAYMRKGEQAPTAAQIAEARTMDCIDCHNRPTHLFQFPARSVDDVIERHEDLAKLPFYKREAVKAIKGAYPTREAGRLEVKKALEGFYAANYPAVPKNLATRGADAAAEIYGKISFPEMKTNWETHPSHIGHPDPSTDEGFAGCWRCHDDKLSTADGKHTIPQDCDNCHTFLVEDSPTPPEFASN
ncbi:MAG TPA: NapC/NirT family cytochrome c [Candidatus Methanoperedens sp.]|nr:NapC/NirT family cytochrome c [Candidatus Methanoperedens sp.]